MLKSQFRIGIAPEYMPLAYKEAPFGLVGVEVDFANQLGKNLWENDSFRRDPVSRIDSSSPRRTDRYHYVWNVDHEGKGKAGKFYGFLRDYWADGPRAR